MNIIKVEQANAAFVKHETEVARDLEALIAEVNTSIEGTDVSSKSTWGFGGYTTNRVAFVSTDGYLPDAVDAAVCALHKEGYICNPIHIDGEDGGVDILAVLWDPRAAEALELLDIADMDRDGSLMPDEEEVAAPTQGEALASSSEKPFGFVEDPIV